uniref:Uncharacterized protein n=1 Tax=uncultured marine virus TaxID=186617 RepID=S4TDN5_9VIRU|nr:hypothetical protein [uncultured marine virus]
MIHRTFRGNENHFPKLVRMTKLKKALKKRKYTKRYGDMPDHLFVELNYADTVNLNSAVVGYVEHTFALNDLFDPDVTGVGHQPLGRDEYRELFSRYQVSECKYEVWANQNQSTQSIVGCVPTRRSTALTSRTEAMEHPGSVVKMLGTRNIENGIYMTGKINIENFDRFYTNDLEYGAEFDASPAKRSFLKIFVADVAGGTTVNANFIVRLTFKAKVFERRNLLQS